MPWYEYWKHVLFGIRTNYESAITRKGSEAIDADIVNARDLQMGSNLLWLLEEKYKNRKVIVWAASFHNCRNLGGLLSIDEKLFYMNEIYKKTVTMGDIVHKSLGNKMYSIVFTGYKGSFRSFNNEGAEEINKPAEESIENILEGLGYENSYIDLRNPKNPEWLKQKFVSRPLGNNEMEGVWSNITDGIFYTKELKPSTFGNGE